jgi:hypothetical protein
MESQIMRKRLGFKDMLVYLLFASLLVAVLAFAISAIGGLPEIANHFGFALPGDDGLPFRISYLSRDFTSSVTCAGADWCKASNSNAPLSGAGRPLCSHKQDLQENGEWPLMQVGSLFTLPPGSPYPIMVARPGEVVVVYVLKANDCYVSYGLSGGW